MAWLCAATSALAWFAPARAAAPVDYNRDVKPLLRERCYSCHGALKQKAELRLDTGAAIRRGGKDGPILLQDAAQSPLLQRVSSTDPDERMPPEGEPLSSEAIAHLRDWIELGAPSPSEEKPEPDPREHWAFKVPARAPVPPMADAQWEIRNPIDAFIAATSEKRGLAPAPPAAKEILLRRVYLDLIGLPPTRAEFDAFLADDSPRATETLVDRLLASPQYAERWARHWMDIWRYADWYGRRHVPDVWNSAPQIWRWRDWIVDSLHADKGYDRMIVEMLAGDEVAPEDDSVRVATGYLVRNWYALNPNQWMRDIVEHTGKAFLGLTFNCAHCHDHKYDPITQRDYFRFRAFFEPLQVRQDWVKGEPDPGPFQKYEYSTVRKVVADGMVSVFDERPDARTGIYVRGDERSFAEGKPTVGPGMPGFLDGDMLKVAPVNLPPVAYNPRVKPFIQDAENGMREQALATARAAFEMAENAFCELQEAPPDKAGEKEKASIGLKKAREQLTAAQSATAPRPIYPARSSGRRKALAEWMTNRNNPLTARVAINHIWMRHFHAPLVASVYDFGRNGAPPTHPELLDWLAVEFMENGWSIKHMHRLIVTSAAYRRASSMDPRLDAPAESRNKTIDPENRYLWRNNPGQMEAELVRDSILHLAGELDLTRGGRPIANSEAEKSRRRTLYFECFPEPNGQSEFAAAFDPPEPMECYRRSTTVVPQQALALSNSKLCTELSEIIARRLVESGGINSQGDESPFIEAAYRQLLTRPPSGKELAACVTFLVKQTSLTKAETARASLVRVLLNHHDFVTIR